MIEWIPGGGRRSGQGRRGVGEVWLRGSQTPVRTDLASIVPANRPRRWPHAPT